MGFHKGAGVIGMTGRPLPACPAAETCRHGTSESRRARAGTVRSTVLPLRKLDVCGGVCSHAESARAEGALTALPYPISRARGTTAACIPAVPVRTAGPVAYGTGRGYQDSTPQYSALLPKLALRSPVAASPGERPGAAPTRASLARLIWGDPSCPLVARAVGDMTGLASLGRVSSEVGGESWHHRVYASPVIAIFSPCQA